MKNSIRLTLELSTELNDRLEELTRTLGGTKSDALRKAISLLEITVNSKQRGLKLGLVAKDQPVVTEIYGL